MQNNTVVEIVNLEKKYIHKGKRIFALDNVTFSVKRGEVFAILGPNGAGKTTMIKLLLNFVFPNKGKLRINGLCVTNPLAREKVGYVPEDLSMPDFVNAAKLLKFLADLSACSSQQSSVKINDLLNISGLLEANFPINMYSKGMKRRLSIIQSLVHQPNLLLLDEPTDGLDPIERQRVLDMLINFRNQGGTILLCSHILSEVETLCDRYIFLDRGRLVHQGSRLEINMKQYVITLTLPIPENLLYELSQKWDLEKSTHQLKVTITDKNQLNLALSWLNKFNLRPDNVVSQNMDLKSLFLQFFKNRIDEQ